MKRPARIILRPALLLSLGAALLAFSGCMDSNSEEKVTPLPKTAPPATGGSSVTVPDTSVTAAPVPAAPGTPSPQPLPATSPSPVQPNPTTPLVETLTEEMSKAHIKKAGDFLAQKEVPTAGREAKVTLAGDLITVTFAPPQGARAGEFIVTLSKTTGEVVDHKIWR